MNKTYLDAAKALYSIRHFIGPSQKAALNTLFRGEEKQFFFDKICELSDIIAKMPKTYEQNGKGDQAVVYLHYFVGACDWHITEKDSVEDEQVQAFGQANLGYGAELGYINIEEILANGGELDFYFTPKTLAEVNRK